MTSDLREAAQAVDALKRLNISDVIIGIVELLTDQIREQAAELERGKIAREQFADDNAALAEAIAENNKLLLRVKDAEDNVIAARVTHREDDKIIRQAWHDLYQLEDERDELRSKLNDTERERHALATQVDDLTGELTQARIAVQAGVELDAMRREDIDDRRQMNASQACKIASLNRDVKTQAQTIANLKNEIEGLWQSARQEVANRLTSEEQYWAAIKGLTRHRDELKHDKSTQFETINNQAARIFELSQEVERLNGRRVEWKCDKCGSRFSRDIEDPRGCPNCTADGQSKTFICLHN